MTLEQAFTIAPLACGLLVLAALVLLAKPQPQWEPEPAGQWERRTPPGALRMMYVKLRHGYRTANEDLINRQIQRIQKTEWPVPKDERTATIYLARLANGNLHRQ